MVFIGPNENFIIQMVIHITDLFFNLQKFPMLNVFLPVNKVTGMDF
jgi:hypothetical protein